MHQTSGGIGFPTQFIPEEVSMAIIAWRSLLYIWGKNMIEASSGQAERYIPLIRNPIGTAC